MFKTFHKKIAVNLITGSLGAGKTTLLRQFIANKPAAENWAILVNEFGAIGIDGSIFESEQLKNQLQVEQIPGGCICCTAQNELKESIQNIIKKYHPDRLFIEPTGLGEPDTLVDLLQSQLFQQHFDIQSVFAVIDSASMTLEEIEQYTILQNLFSMADVIVLNKSDIAEPDNLNALQNYALNLFPAKHSIVTTQQASVNIDLINKSVVNKDNHTQPIQSSPGQLVHHTDMNQQKTTQNNQILESSIELPGLVTRKVQTQLATKSIGWLFEASVIFDWTAIQTLFKSLNQLPSNTKPKRAKGVFRVGKPWMLFQWVNDQSSREYIAYRRDSRIELLLPENSLFDIEQFEVSLKNCIKPCNN